MTRIEGLLAKILRLISRAMVEGWDFDYIIENIERLTETYRLIKED